MQPVCALLGQPCPAPSPQEGFSEHLLLNELAGTEGIGPRSEELGSGLRSWVCHCWVVQLCGFWISVPSSVGGRSKLHDSEGSTRISRPLFSRNIGPGTLSSAPA